MKVSGIKVLKVAYGREYETRAGEKKRDLMARCYDAEGEDLGSESFFDYAMTPDEATAHTKTPIDGKTLELRVDRISIPFKGSSVKFSGKILSAK